MEFRILGPLEVLDGDRPVEIAGSKRRAVLALLLLHANEVVRTERLIDDLWGEQPPRNASNALHNHVSRLRKALGPEVVARREWGYVLRADPNSIDLRRFEQLVAAAEPLPAAERSSRLAEALELWRGPALADLSGEPALQTEIARLEELRLSVLENRIDADLEAGNRNAIIGELETLISENPLRERLRGQLILALYRDGRQAEALEVYRETRRVLTEELGLEPSPALRELERGILRQDPALAPAEASVGEEREGPVGRRRRVYGGVAAGLVLGLSGALAGTLATRGTHSAEPARPPVTHAPATTASKALGTTAVVTHPKARSTPRRKQHRTAHALAASPVKHGPARRTSRRSPEQDSTVGSTTAVATGSRSKPRKRKPNPPKASKPVRIADDFSDGSIDSLIWTTWAGGTSATSAQRDGQLIFSISPDATFETQFNTVGISYGTKCKFPGDFDARVHFALLDWPNDEGVSASLVAFQTGPVKQISRTTSSRWGDFYAAWPGRGAVALPDTSGSLRIARSRGTVRTYIRHHGRWRELDKQPIAGEIWVGMTLQARGDDWRQAAISASFDDFLVVASDADCPPGSDPRNS